MFPFFLNEVSSSKSKYCFRLIIWSDERTLFNVLLLITMWSSSTNDFKISYWFKPRWWYSSTFSRNSICMSLSDFQHQRVLIIFSFERFTNWSERFFYLFEEIFYLFERFFYLFKRFTNSSKEILYLFERIFYLFEKFTYYSERLFYLFVRFTTSSERILYLFERFTNSSELIFFVWKIY